MEFDSNEAQVQHKHLHIAIRSELPQEHDVTSGFFIGVLKMLHLLKIPMKAQSIGHLEDLVRMLSGWRHARRVSSWLWLHSNL